MLDILVFCFIYITAILITYIGISLLVNVNVGVDREFDSAMSDRATRMCAILFVSIIWPITIPIIIINNIRRKEDK